MTHLNAEDALRGLLDDPYTAALVDMAHDRAELMRQLRAARKAAGMSQTDLGDAIETQQSTISELEGLDNDPRLSTLQRFAWGVGGWLDIHLNLERNCARRTDTSSSPSLFAVLKVAGPVAETPSSAFTGSEAGTRWNPLGIQWRSSDDGVPA